ncbi:MAG: DUF4238 domain-containing protein [Lachnospiraceae bacterium]|nr:DUF4238 domain-containing protein [Lachnospiraceae bacterium]
MINSHYIPQFILRNFYDNDKITYCDLEKKTVQSRNTRSIFSEEGYYPENIEKDLCKKAEYQFANLYHNKLENARNSLSLTSDELFTLKKFLIVSAIRYKGTFSEEEKKLFDSFGPLYKVDYDANLNRILACKNKEEAFKILDPFFNDFDKMINGNDDSINMHLMGELKEILHSYIVFIKPRGDEKFLIPDIGRGYWEGHLGLNKVTALMETLMATGDPTVFHLLELSSVRDYTVYPLSKNLAVLTMSIFFKLLTDSEIHMNIKMPKEFPTVSAILGFGDKNVIRPPKVRLKGSDKEYLYEINPITPKDVAHFNSIMLAEAKRYVACAGLETVQKSLKSVGEYSDRDYSFMSI